MTQFDEGDQRLKLIETEGHTPYLNTRAFNVDAIFVSRWAKVFISLHMTKNNAMTITHLVLHVASHAYRNQ